MYYVYEGRTIKGIGLMGWALLVQVIAVIAQGVTQAAFGLAFGSILTNPADLLGPFLGTLAALCGIEIAELGVAIVFLIGFFQAHAGRHEYGLEQSRSLERALVLLIVFIVLSAVGAGFSASSVFTPGLTGQAILTDLTGDFILAPLGALFAGLTLLQTIGSISGEPVRSRLRFALGLGVVGAVVGPLLILLATAGSTITVDLLASGILASAIAGQGISAISLLLFWLAYRETRRSLEAGTPAPVLPRIEQLYPLLYRPMYPYSPPSAEGPPPPKP